MSEYLYPSFPIGIGRQVVQDLFTSLLFFLSGFIELFVILADAAACGGFFALLGLLFFRRRTLTAGYPVKMVRFLKIPLSDMFYGLCNGFLG